MSSVKRKNVDAKILEQEQVDPELKKQALQTGIYNISTRNPFIGSVLQCLDIEYSHMIPRLGIMFDADGKKWKMMINPFFFCKQLNTKSQAAVLLHEISHVTHKHPFRAPFLKISPHRRHLMNIAMDMSINQYIPDLPAGCQSCPPVEEMFKGARCTNEMCPGRCIMVEDYYDFDDKGNKVQWPTNRPFEDYYHRLIERFSENEDDEEGDGEGEGSGGSKNSPEDFDSHHWETNAEEAEMMDATEELVKRAMQKQGLSYDKLPQHVRELLQDIEARRSELNYRQLILSAIKKHASGFEREHSWTRRSRRFGLKAPGTRNGNLPFLGNYIDTSGSISIQEANDFLDIIDQFLKVGSRKCHLSLWHTGVYYSERYKLGDRLDKSVFQSGGTDLEDTMRHIHKNQPDLSIILTDGCYSDVEVEQWLNPGESFPQVLFIISRDGTEDHPLRRLGETIKIPNTDHYGRDKNLEGQ